MKLKILTLLSVFGMWALFFSSEAIATTKFKGAFLQGGLIIGKTLPKSTILSDGQIHRITSDGYFLLGFGRNEPLKKIVKIISPNGIDKLYELKIKRRTYKISRINGLPEKTVSPNKLLLARIKKENKTIRLARQIDSTITNFKDGFIWPTKGRISGVFGSLRILNKKPRSPHNGIDIAAKPGTPVIAPAGGIITLIKEDMLLSGKTVMIDHGHGLSSIYIHLEKILVNEGKFVIQGEKIGTVGMTGRATGPHLHWGVTLFNKHIDPALLIKSQKNTTSTN